MLVATATKVIERDGIEALSLRALARELGVTSGAPHHHFAERDDLLGAVAEHGWAELVEHVQRRLAATTPKPLHAGAHAYVGFALARPELYRLMTSRRLRDRARFAALHERGRLAFQFLVGLVEHALGVRGAAARATAVTAWSALHGFVSLVSDGYLDDEIAATDRDALIAATIDVALGALGHLIAE
jgi:AcrR family transcriptional regulator